MCSLLAAAGKSARYVLRWRLKWGQISPLRWHVSPPLFVRGFWEFLHFLNLFHFIYLIFIFLSTTKYPFCWVTYKQKLGCFGCIALIKVSLWCAVQLVQDYIQIYLKISFTNTLYIYIYIYKCKCLLLTDNLQFYSTNWFKIFREYFIRIQECFYILIIKKYYNN